MGNILKCVGCRAKIQVDGGTFATVHVANALAAHECRQRSLAQRLVRAIRYS